MNLFWTFVLIAVLLGFVMLIMYVPQQDVIPYNNDVQQLITTFTKSGEYIGFDMGVVPPVTKYVYDSQKNIVGKILENSTISPVTEEEAKELSSLNVNIQDRKLNQIKTCKIGYQCDITGIINLIDPVSGNRIPPPYAYLIMIGCDYREFCSMNPSLASNEASFPDGTFKYTWTIPANITVGEYEVSVYVPSHYTNENGEQERRLAVTMIEVIQ